jgi:hypothetical protein
LKGLSANPKAIFVKQKCPIGSCFFLSEEKSMIFLVFRGKSHSMKHLAYVSGKNDAMIAKAKKDSRERRM